MIFTALDFPIPNIYSCKTIVGFGEGGMDGFTRKEFRYRLNNNTKRGVNVTSFDKISTILTLWELHGAQSGVYTWLLFDFGDKSPKQILVKRNINFTEINTKHSDILRDICSNKQHTDGRSPLTNESIIRVYFGGELSKSINETTRKIQYTINFLSGSFSIDQVNTETFSPKLETELTNAFRIGICDGDPPSFDIVIARTTQSLITANMGTDKEFWSSMRDYNSAGLNLYKFPKEDLTFYRTARDIEGNYNNASNLMDRQLQEDLTRTRKRNHGVLDNKEEEMITNIYKKRLDKVLKPLPSSELEAYRVELGGGKSRNSSKSRKKSNKSKSHKSSKSHKPSKFRKPRYSRKPRRW
jgi:hypothetical protein